MGSRSYRATGYRKNFPILEKTFSDVAVLGVWQLNASCGNFFSLQAGAEAEGSGLGWGLDVSSGSGDLVGSEELLRVSVKENTTWCLGLPSK